jgi:DNA polymerase/3'-5' exonuclease PolX
LFKGKKRIAGRTEKEIYNVLGIAMPTPEKRIGASE